MSESIQSLLEEAGVTDDMGYSKESLWDGPQSSSYNGGVTFSLLSKYLVCKERARVSLIEGLQPADKFNHRLEYGNMWHLCEEIYAKHKMLPGVLANLVGYRDQLMKKYPMRQEEVLHWHNVCAVQFPVYIDFLKKNGFGPVGQSDTLLSEEVFDIPYLLPSGKTVYLRGKWDKVDLYNGVEIRIQENKTKADIEPDLLQKQLKFDLQTMIYLVALYQYFRSPECPFEIQGQLNIGGIIYNVIRRPLSGGHGNIKPKKGSKNIAPETMPEFYQRLKGVIDGTNKDYETGPEYFFMRWKIDITEHEVMNFRKICLDPILENVCNDYEWWNWCQNNQKDVFNFKLREDRFEDHTPKHFVFPYGIYNPLTEEGTTVLDTYILTGNKVGLEKNKNLFPELQA